MAARGELRVVARVEIHDGRLAVCLRSGRWNHLLPAVRILSMLTTGIWHLREPLRPLQVFGPAIIIVGVVAVNMRRAIH